MLGRPAGIGIASGTRNGLTLSIGTRTFAEISRRDAAVVVAWTSSGGRRLGTARWGDLGTTIKTKATTSRTAAVAATAVTGKAQ